MGTRGYPLEPVGNSTPIVNPNPTGARAYTRYQLVSIVGRDQPVLLEGRPEFWSLSTTLQSIGVYDAIECAIPNPSSCPNR